MCGYTLIQVHFAVLNASRVSEMFAVLSTTLLNSHESQAAKDQGQFETASEFAIALHCQ